MTKYPKAIDTNTELPKVADNATAVNASTVNRLRDAILAIENELGVKPSSSYSTVRGRLDYIESIFNSFVSTGNGFNANGDLSGNNLSQTVIKIQGRSISTTTPLDGYVLTWISADSYWAPRAQTGGGGGGGSPTGSAGGDLSGTYPNPSVAKINSSTVPVGGSLTTGNTLQVSGSSSLTYGPLNLAGGANYVTGLLPAANQSAQTLGGDLSGTTSSATVTKIRGISVNASPSASQILVATGGTTSIWSQIYDGYIASAANITGSKIASATSGSVGVIQLTGDLGGTATSPTVTGLQTYDVSSAAPTDGYVLTWVNSDSYWAPRASSGGGGGSPTGSAGGDLSGTYPNPTVAKANGATIPAAGSLTTGNVLQVSGTSALSYGAINLAGGSNYVTGVLPTGNQASQTLGGDLSGTTASGTVIKINGTSVPSSPSANQIIVATNGTTAIWSQIYDGYIASAANITGSKISSATTGALGVVQLAGDISGTATSVTVSKIQNRTINNTSPTDGYVLTWVNSDSYWAPRAAAGGSPTGSAGGDLSSTYPNPTVAKIQNRTVNSTAPTDGYVLTWVNSDSYWAPRAAAGGAPSGSAGGDLSGTYPNPTVAKVNGTSVPSGPSANQVLVATSGTVSIWSQIYDGYISSSANITGSKIASATTGAVGVIQLAGDIAGTATSVTVSKINGSSVPAGGSLTTGNVLQVTGSSALSYGAINLAGGSNYVTGVLPTANQASQSLGGDLSGTTASATVIKLQTRAVSSTAPTDGYFLKWVQANNQWEPASAPSGSFTAGGDLSGSSSSQTVIAIQGRSVNSTAPTDGYVLTWSQADSYWVPRLTTNKLATAVISANYSVVTNDQLIAVDGTSGSITVTLPSSPAVGTRYIIKDQNGLATTNNIIISGNGNNIDGSSTFTIDENYGSITVVFANSRWGII
jgi:hypothetical protein